MNRDLPNEAVAFGAASARAMADAGGTDLARRAESDPLARKEAADVLGRLGAGDLDPREDLEHACAAGELCRAAGSVAFPYPVVASLLAAGGEPLAVATGPGPPAVGAVPERPPGDQTGAPAPAPALADWRQRVDHGDLFPRWRVAWVDGSWRPARPAGERLGTRLGPFLADLATVSGAGGEGAEAEVALHLSLTGWRLLGTAQRALALAVGHVRDRVQFGQPLAAFQAVQFQLADASVALDGLDGLCRFTLWSLFADPSSALVDALALRLHALDVTRTAVRVSQQLHGAAGVCDEYDISVLCRHVQPDLRLPWGSEATAALLMDVAAARGFAGLFPHR